MSLLDKIAMFTGYASYATVVVLVVAIAISESSYRRRQARRRARRALRRPGCIRPRPGAFAGRSFHSGRGH